MIPHSRREPSTREIYTAVPDFFAFPEEMYGQNQAIASSSITKASAPQTEVSLNSKWLIAKIAFQNEKLETSYLRGQSDTTLYPSLGAAESAATLIASIANRRYVPVNPSYEIGPFISMQKTRDNKYIPVKVLLIKQSTGYRAHVKPLSDPRKPESAFLCDDLAEASGVAMLFANVIKAPLEWNFFEKNFYADKKTV